MIEQCLRIVAVFLVAGVLCTVAKATQDIFWHITVDESTVCRLEARFTSPQANTGDSKVVITFGFLAHPVGIPIGEIPAGEVVVIIELGIPKSDLRLAPTGLTANGYEMELYQWDAPSTMDQFFFLLKAEEAEKLFASTRQGRDLELIFTLSDGAKHEERITFDGSSNFHIYAAMLDACGREILKQ